MNTTLNREQLIGRLNWRYATKEFDTKRKISPEDWATLEDALVLTPSSAGLEPWKFIVVTDPAKRQELIGVSYGQRQIVDASHLVVFAARTNFGVRDVDAYIDRIAKTRGVPVESLAGFRDMLIGGIIQGKNDVVRQEWASRQAYIALGNFLNSAALLGIDACPMEGFDPAKYNQILGLTEKGLSAVVVAAAGYRAATDKYAGLKKVRSPKSEVVVRI